MKRPSKIGFGPLVLAALVLVVVLAFVFRDRLLPADIVRSADSSAQLRIPWGALPKGVKAESISIVRTPTSADGQLAHYAFSPDGLRFAKPAVLVVSLPIPEQPSANAQWAPVPQLVLMSGDGKQAENLDSSVELDPSARVVRTTAEIGHFSSLDVLSFASGRIDSPRDQTLGDSFFLGARLTLDRTIITVPIENDPNFAAYVHQLSDWYLWDGQFVSNADTTTPEKIGNVPQTLTPEEGASGRPSYVVARSFTCARTGDAGVRYRVFSDAKLQHFVQDRTGATTEIVVPDEDVGGAFQLATRPFRCLGGEETVIDEPPKGEKVLVSSWAHDILQTRSGQFEILIAPSATRVSVGQGLNVDVTITDISDRAIEKLPVAERAAYRAAWQAKGTWYASPMFDRTEVDIPDYHRMNHLGKLTFRLPLTCKAAGKGSVSFDADVQKLTEGEPKPLLEVTVEHAGTSSQTGTIECVAPAGEQEPKTEPIRFGVSPISLVATHVVGTTSCPQTVGAFTVEAPEGSTWTASGIPAWLEMPRSGTAGKVPVKFNCGITQFGAHAEEANVLFRSGEESASAQVRMNIESGR